MRGALRIALLLAAFALPAGLAPQPAVAAAQRDWTKTVVATPEGGFRMGNPAAAVKLIEYGSLTCPHCAHFSAEGVPGLIGDVRSGRLSYEFRNFVRDPADLGAALVSRCVPPGRYFEVTAKLFDTQQQWIGRVMTLDEEQQKALDALEPAARVSRLAEIADVAGVIGVPAAQAKACLADGKATEKLLDMRRVAIEQVQLEGTPTFLINGKKVSGVFDWASLQPHLKAGS